jgi:aryl-alcohol dehydrogenase-like predicted oxidoreductase
MFMAHAWDPMTPVEETMSTLHDIVRSGKARYIGASTMYAWQFAHMNHVARENGWTPFCNMQLQYNLLYREEEREMIPYCEHQGIALTSFSPLARGWLSGARNELRAGCDTYYNRNYGDDVDLNIVAKVQSIARERGVSNAQVAIAWVLSKKAIAAPIISAPSTEQLDLNIKSLEVRLTEEEIESLDVLYHPRDLINDYVTELTPRYSVTEK